MRNGSHPVALVLFHIMWRDVGDCEVLDSYDDADGSESVCLSQLCSFRIGYVPCVSLEEMASLKWTI